MQIWCVAETWYGIELDFVYLQNWATCDNYESALF